MLKSPFHSWASIFNTFLKLRTYVNFSKNINDVKLILQVREEDIRRVKEGRRKTS